MLKKKVEEFSKYFKQKDNLDDFHHRTMISNRQNAISLLEAVNKDLKEDLLNMQNENKENFLNLKENVTEAKKNLKEIILKENDLKENIGKLITKMNEIGSGNDRFLQFETRQFEELKGIKSSMDISNKLTNEVAVKIYDIKAGLNDLSMNIENRLNATENGLNERITEMIDRWFAQTGKVSNGGRYDPLSVVA
jgi:chromosome segregation ATPase